MTDTTPSRDPSAAAGRTISIEDLEALAASIEGEEEARRQQLFRIIAAQTRILAAKAPERFPRVPLERREDAEASNQGGPQLLELLPHRCRDLPETGDPSRWRRVTPDRGIYLTLRGELYGCTERGTVQLGQFAGGREYDCELEWSRLEAPEIPTARLEEAEKRLRGMLPRKL